MVGQAIRVTRRTFTNHVDRFDLKALEARLGYKFNSTIGLTMEHDWHVTYWRSRWRGRLCYYLNHSGVEYIFA